MNGDRLHTKRPSRLDRFMSVIGLGDIRQRNMGAFTRETRHDRSSDAPAATGDERTCMLKWKFHEVLPLWEIVSISCLTGRRLTYIKRRSRSIDSYDALRDVLPKACDPGIRWLPICPVV
jgi:hypothetical protein